ncbi:carbohydrate ABC transporter permease [Leifsonia poae]|uniref:ABC transporter permease n=1 Tax=Leifsonia poae TaxID=110933 RepID=A0A9W6LZ74_9MICO|nr:carbohydrate ABC transporter permease [Leifsonia poae]GLJ75314.1 ABC transporter permease [Leifsonia poae]
MSASVSTAASSGSRVAATAARRKRSPRQIAGRIVWYIAVVLVSIVTVMPLIWTISTSLKPAGEILSGYLNLIPSAPTIGNYVAVFSQTPFARYMFNSFLLAFIGTATNLFFGGLAGYALAKFRFRGRRVVFSMFLGSMMIPTIVTMIPTFLVLRYFPLAGGNDLFGQGGVGFINTYWAIIIPFAAGPFAVFFMKQVFEALPDELGEAARIDGASEFRIFRQVYLPMATAGLAVLGVLTFQAGWNSFLWPLIVLSDPSLLTVQVGLSSFVSDHQTDYGPLMAGTIVSTVPVLVVFVFAQRWIVQGVAHTASK